MKKSIGRNAKKFAIAAMLLLVMLLTGCGEQKKYDQAAALEAAGNYHEAWQLFFSLGPAGTTVILDLANLIEGLDEFFVGLDQGLHVNNTTF